MNASQRISFIFYPILFGVTLITSSLDGTFMPYGISVVLTIVFIANCIKCLGEYRKGNMPYASIILIFSCIVAVHIVYIQFSNFYNYTSYIIFIFLECIYFIALVLAARQTVASIRASFTVLFLKGLCLGILPIRDFYPEKS